MTAPYLLRVNSRPIKTDASNWQKWYTTEHIPDLQNAGVSTIAALYRATHDLGGLSTATPVPSDEKEFLAMYQTHHAAPLDTAEYKAVRSTSEMLPGNEIRPNGEWDIRNYELIQDFDPRGVGSATPPPFILNVIIEPGDDADYDAWYRDEHLGMLAKVPGYRRSQRYRLLPLSMTPADTPRFLAVHEFDSLAALDGDELREADASVNTKRILREASVMDIRGFRLVEGFGYGR